MINLATPKVSFTDPQIARERDILAQLKDVDEDGYFKGPIVFEELKGARGEPLGAVMHIGNPYLDNPSYVTLPTNCTREQIEKIRSRVIWHREACEIFQTIAESFKMGHILIIEGESSIGKTFLVKKFCECRFGSGVEPIKQECNKHTDVSELTGRFLPNTKGTPGAGASPWKMQLGKVPQAFLAKIEPDGSYSFPVDGGGGTILDIEEANTAPSGVTNFLLHIRGNNKKVVDRLIIHDLDDLEVRRGPNAWVVLTINPCDGDFLERHPLDPALARAADFACYGDLSPRSYLMATQKYLNYKVGNRPQTKPVNCILELYKHPEICNELAEILTAFHLSYKNALKKGEKNREQKIPGTLDDIAGVAEHLISLQTRSAVTGDLDLIETLTRAVRKTYIQRHKEPKLIESLEASLKALLRDPTVGRKEFHGRLQTRAEILEGLVSDASADPAQKLRRVRVRHHNALQHVLKNKEVPYHIKRLLAV